MTRKPGATTRNTREACNNGTEASEKLSGSLIKVFSRRISFFVKRLLIIIRIAAYEEHDKKVADLCIYFWPRRDGGNEASTKRWREGIESTAK